MRSNIFSIIHRLLMECVDGLAADKFCYHITQYVGNVDTINRRYTQTTQIRWMAGYWLMQLSSLQLTAEEKFNAGNLLICSDINEFVTVFKATVLPLVQQHDNLPDVTMPVHSLEAHSHA